MFKSICFFFLLSICGLLIAENSSAQHSGHGSSTNSNDGILKAQPSKQSLPQTTKGIRMGVSVKNSEICLAKLQKQSEILNRCMASIESSHFQVKVLKCEFKKRAWISEGGSSINDVTTAYLNRECGPKSKKEVVECRWPDSDRNEFDRDEMHSLFDAMGIQVVQNLKSSLSNINYTVGYQLIFPTCQSE